MVKANIETSQGSKIVVEGDAEEVAAVVAAVQARDRLLEQRQQSTTRAAVKRTASPHSLVGAVLKLKEDLFFNSPRSVTEVKTELEKNGCFYPASSISTSLIRRVCRGELGRVQKPEGWKYVNR